MPVAAAGVGQWLVGLGKLHSGDVARVGYGHWGDAHLQLEDRGAGRLLVEAAIPDALEAAWREPPDEWVGAVDVTDDPAWARATLTCDTWPVASMFTPIEAQPAVAWGAPLEPKDNDVSTDA